jgi:opacity protein-like surface antigen
MQKSRILTAVASIALLASVAQADTNAQAPIKIPNSGWYVVGGLGANYFYGDYFDFLMHAKGLGPMLMLGSGYKFNNYFALELDFPISVARAHEHAFNGSDLAYTHIESIITLNAKFIQPLSNRWDLYEKLGLGTLASFNPGSKERGNYVGEMVVNFGLGADYQLTHSLAVGMEVSSALSLGLLRPAVTANVTYYFGS